MKLKNYKKKLSSLFMSLIIIGLGFVTQVQAAPIISENTLGKDCYENGNCSLNHFIKIIEQYYKNIFGLIGSIALIMFIIGGVMFLVSGGSQEKVSKAKSLMLSAVIGLLIIFASYLIIEFVLKTVGYENVDNWNTTP